MNGDDALRNMAHRKVEADPGRRRLITAVIAGPTALITGAVTLLGLSVDPGEPMMPLWVVLASGVGIIGWTFVFGFLFLISLAAFAVSDRQTTQDLRLLRTNGASEDQQRRFMRYHAMVPGRRGVVLGAVIGMVGAIGLQLIVGSASLHPLHAISVPLAVTILALVAGAGVAAGARWPRRFIDPAPVEKTSGNGSPTGEPTKPSPTWSDRRSLLTTAAGVAMLVTGVVMFSGINGVTYGGLELLGYNLLIVGTIVLIAGLVMILPDVFRIVTKTRTMTMAIRRGPGWLHYATADLNRNPGRVGKAAGAVLALATLTVMAAAGIQSDTDTRSGVKLDARYIVSSSARPSLLSEIEATLDGAPEIGGYVTTRVGTVQVQMSDQPGFGQVLQAAILDDVLIGALGVTESELAAADNGAVLVNSDLVEYERSEFDDGVDLLHLEHGEGLLTPLGLLVGAARQPSPSSRLYTAYITRHPMSSDTRRQIIDLNNNHPEWIDVRSTGFAPTGNQIVLVFTAVAGLLAVGAGAGTSLLAARSDRSSLDIVDDLGLSPAARRLMLSSQAGFQQLVAGVAGSLLGVVLFWLVTRGDPSVPDAIIPWITITAFTIVVPLLTATLVALVPPPAKVVTDGITQSPVVGAGSTTWG